MLNTAISAVLLTIATPAQTALAALLAIPAALFARQCITAPGIYPHLEIHQAQEYLEFCLRVYGWTHDNTKRAAERIPLLIAGHYKAKLIDEEDLRTFIACGDLDSADYQRLTGQAF